jgi:hypothetical protein
LELDINIETKHDSYYNKNYIFLHEDLDCNQMYNFVFNHDDKFSTFLTTKDIQNQNEQHPLKGFNTCAFKNINTCGLSYEVH